MTLRLISWNVNKRRAIDEQIAALTERQPDLVALQEVKARHLEAIHSHFASLGLPYVLDSKVSPETSHRGYVVAASRWPLTLKRFRRLHANSVCPEATLSVILETPYGIVELHAVHVPYIGNGDWLKCRFLEELYARLAHRCGHHRILCGDFNFPQRELPDGTVITFGEKIRKDGTYYVRRGLERQAEAEFRILRGLAKHDLRDVYRSVNGFAAQESSWIAYNRGRTFGYRLDHILASASLRSSECTYLHTLREGSFSDHSPVEATFAPAENSNESLLPVAMLSRGNRRTPR